MKTQTLTFTAPYAIEIGQASLPPLGLEDVLVESICSAISPGTEMLVYRGQFPHMTVDPCIPGMGNEFRYPLAYGYASVGRIVETGKRIKKEWVGRLVFAFQPHASHFVAHLGTLISIPYHLPAETACFLPNMETAVNLVQDAAPLLGERSLILGQGIIGLLATSLLAQFPLEKLVSADSYPLRQAESLLAGANSCLDPNSATFHEQARALLPEGADFTLELSGSPAALDEAIALTGYSGRVIIGSWYGEKRATLNLGGDFHRSRIQLISSQVSTIRPELSGRWNKQRRFGVAWKALASIRPEKWITHRFPIQKAAEAYQLLDQNPSGAIQVILTYNEN
jgi:2-desacetyl-2-hydroxyethyl bacteriochlorophyllide A dehydrogenase